MANKEHLALLKQGVDVWNQWKKEHESIVPDLSGTNFRGVDLRWVDFSNVDLSGADLSGVDLRWVNLSGADLSEVDLSGVDLGGVDLSGVDLSRVDLSKVDLSGAILWGANLSGMDLSGVNLCGADLSGANLSKMKLSGKNLSGVDLSGADLSGANLSGANLSKVDLSGTNLSGANLSRMDLSGMILQETDLNKADLSGADLSKVDLSGKDLTGANLTGADLSYTVLVQTNFSKADLTGCRIYGIAAWDVKLDEANQSDFVITRPDEPDITVDKLEVAQFVYLLLRNENVRHVIDTVTSKVVLILGRFKKDRKIVLDALKDELRRRDYIPILFDFEKPSHRSLTETVRTLAHMARFVIADITDARSIPQELMAIVPALPSVPVQPLLQPGDDTEYAMFESLKQYPWVLPIYQYKDATEAVAEIKNKIIDPAEAKASELMPGKTQEKTSGT